MKDSISRICADSSINRLSYLKPMSRNSLRFSAACVQVMATILACLVCRYLIRSAWPWCNEQDCQLRLECTDHEEGPYHHVRQISDSAAHRCAATEAQALRHKKMQKWGNTVCKELGFAAE